MNNYQSRKQKIKTSMRRVTSPEHCSQRVKFQQNVDTPNLVTSQAVFFLDHPYPSLQPLSLRKIKLQKGFTQQVQHCKPCPEDKADPKNSSFKIRKLSQRLLTPVSQMLKGNRENSTNQGSPLNRQEPGKDVAIVEPLSLSRLNYLRVQKVKTERSSNGERVGFSCRVAKNKKLPRDFFEGKGKSLKGTQTNILQDLELSEISQVDQNNNEEFMTADSYHNLCIDI